MTNNKKETYFVYVRKTGVQLLVLEDVTEEKAADICEKYIVENKLDELLHETPVELILFRKGGYMVDELEDYIEIDSGVSYRIVVND